VNQHDMNPVNQQDADEQDVNPTDNAS
jgi:hypothetical protein